MRPIKLRLFQAGTTTKLSDFGTVEGPPGEETLKLVRLQAKNPLALTACAGKENIKPGSDTYQVLTTSGLRGPDKERIIGSDATCPRHPAGTECAQVTAS